MSEQPERTQREKNRDLLDLLQQWKAEDEARWATMTAEEKADETEMWRVFYEELDHHGGRHDAEPSTGCPLCSPPPEQGETR
jgi:hypothetical protein